MMVNERREKREGKKCLGFNETLKRNGTQKKGLEHKREKKDTQNYTRTRIQDGRR